MSTRPTRQHATPGYPTLSEFRSDRREFLRTLGMTVAVVVTGSWPALLMADEPGGELPVPGGMKAPPRFELRVPAQGFGSVYLPNEEYLSYALLLYSYEQAFADYVNARAAELNAAIGDLLAGQACAHLHNDGKRAAIEQKALDTINKRYKASNASGEGAHALRIELGSCEVMMPLAGDIAEPPFPGND